MLTCRRHEDRGFSLIEVVIVLAIIAVVLMFGVPLFAEWSQNTQIRATAESIQSGVQSARSEAVRRNLRVEFRLSNNLGAQGGTGWSIWSVNPSAQIQSKPDAEGSYRVVVTTPSGNATDRITFDGSGRTPSASTKNADNSDFLTEINISSQAVSTPRNLRLILSTGGGVIRMCDPNVSTTGDPRKC